MKRNVAAIVGFMGLVSADLEIMQQTFQKMLELKVKHMNLTMDRQLQEYGSGASFGQLQEYGCWCYLGDEHGKGKGSPVDPFDNNCQALHHGITCTEMDVPDCHPAASKTYNVVVTVDPNGDQVIDCESLNVGDQCAENVCYLESFFAANFLGLVLEQFITPNLFKYKTRFGFDNSVCGTTLPPGRGDYTEMCCGQYATNTRKPIRKFVGDAKECCERDNGRFSVFNPNLNDCCEGRVESLGAC